MLTIKQWMEICNYKITEGGDYSPGYTRIYSLESWNGDQNGYSLFIGFDPDSQEVYTAEVHDYKNSRSYRLINTKFSEHFTDNEAYEDVDFIDLEVDEDWIEKATAIFAGKEYDQGIIIPLNFTDAELLPIFKRAHEANMSFNDFINLALASTLAQLKKDKE